VKTRAPECVALERLLQALQRERLTPLELRILLRVTEGEMTSAAIAQSMQQPPSVVGRASAQLVARGMLRRHRRGRPLKLTLSATSSGTSALWRVSRSLAGQPVSATETPAGSGHRVTGRGGRSAPRAPGCNRTLGGAEAHEPSANR
jgi:hypothetical protein